MTRIAPPVLLAGLFMAGCTGQAPSEKETVLPEQAPTVSRCFLQVTAGDPIVVDGDTLERPVDSLMVHLDITGELVNGEYNWLPQEKDQMTGSFTGTLENGVVTALYTYAAEGMTGKQEVLFKLAEDGLHVGSGDMVVAQGISVFKDKSKVEYSPAVPEVPCP
jgi:hypothetical protein